MIGERRPVDFAGSCFFPLFVWASLSLVLTLPKRSQAAQAERLGLESPEQSGRWSVPTNFKKGLTAMFSLCLTLTYGAMSRTGCDGTICLFLFKSPAGDSPFEIKRRSPWWYVGYQPTACDQTTEGDPPTTGWLIASPPCTMLSTTNSPECAHTSNGLVRAAHEIVPSGADRV
jgi:hypothetical protein